MMLHRVKVTLLLGVWTALAMVLLAQDKSSGKGKVQIEICEHAAQGDSKPIDLKQVAHTYAQMEKGFADIVRAKVEQTELEPKFSFDSGLVRKSIRERVVQLPRSLPKTFANVEILIGELKDLASFAKEPNPRRVYLLAKAASLEEISNARAAVGPVGLATPDVTRLFGLDGYPARILFTESDRVQIKRP